MDARIGAAGVVVFLVGLGVGFGVLGPLSVVCTQNCTAGVQVNFTYTVSSLTVNLTDTSVCSPTCDGHYPSVAVAWGDNSTARDTNGGPGWSKLPTGATFTHTYAKAGNYLVAETIDHETCGRSACSNTMVVGEETIPVATICTTNCGSQNETTVNASFSWVAQNETVSIHDTSAVTGSPAITSIAVAWGDGAGTPETKLGFSASHAYAASGTFNITETVDWEASGSPYVSYYTASVNVSSSSSSSGGGGGGPVYKATPFAWSVLSGLLLATGAAVAVLAFAPLSPKVVGIALAVAVPAGAIAGYLLGAGALL